jgi:hypothetical protein
MPQTYAFQVSLPVSSLLARDRIVNRFHMQHVAGGLLGPELEAMCGSIAALWQTRYNHADKEVDVRCYDTDAVPNYPRAHVILDAGAIWAIDRPREVALVLSYSGENRGNRNERGRMYLCPALNSAMNNYVERPTPGQLQWVLDWYTKANESLPDLGGVDWKFGVYSKTRDSFKQTTQCWVNDDWDVQRRRGLRESTRLTAQREG